MSTIEDQQGHPDFGDMPISLHEDDAMGPQGSLFKTPIAELNWLEIKFQPSFDARDTLRGFDRQKTLKFLWEAASGNIDEATFGERYPVVHAAAEGDGRLSDDDIYERYDQMDAQNPRAVAVLEALQRQKVLSDEAKALATRMVVIAVTQIFK